MNHTLFAFDLDNTMIHSFSHKTENDECIEMIGEKQQGFISRSTIELLKTIAEKAIILPITTRSIDQYSRIIWPRGCKPQYAITSNGGVLLSDDKVDKTWHAVSMRAVEPYQEELKKIEEKLLIQNRYIRCRIVDDMFLFAYTKDGVDIQACVNEYKSTTTLDVIASGRKIYFFPPLLNKGDSLDRFCKIVRVEKIICAGDSAIDIPMLSRADISIVPNKYLEQRINGENTIVADSNSVFSEFILKTALANIG